ncbi:Disease resistance protein [Quillaja saponaria]|uniref:Disease resistance protein n=1 Tax=Quillaja saponaria TaxID=32244 RepID=A0AAD7VDR5_QUISA|nr:Disease resistance protein [Quillaja saponaria]
MQNTRTLIILDDIWSELDFESIGLPYGEKGKGCKILITSRNVHVCRKLGSQKNFTISGLLENEAWDFFKMMATDTVDQLDMKLIAKDVADECDCLPLAIVTVATTLRGKPKYSWLAALARLRKPSGTSFSKMKECTELSYNFLKSEEAKSFLLLSAYLFPEDFDIPIEEVVRCGVGFGWFKDIVVVVHARNEVHLLVDELKECFLLLDSNKKECFKVHDVVRDVARSIASRVEHGLMIRWDAELTDWPQEDIWHNSTAVSLKFGKLKEHPGGIACPKLKLLHVGYRKDSALHEYDFFQGMNSLTVLSLQNLEILSDFQPLHNLHTLCLEHCRLSNVSIIVEVLKKLQILSFFDSHIDEVPASRGQLSDLRLLDLTNCYLPNKESSYGLLAAPNFS